MGPADVAALVDVGDPRVAPDGGLVAFVVTTVDLEANEYRSRVWLAAADGSAPPRPFTSGRCRDKRPRWAPDGRSLAFVSHREDEGSTLHVIPVVGGGEVTTVANWPEEIEDLAWSPDGTRLAFAARQRDEERYGKEREKDQPPRRIDRLFYRLDDVGWTADRRRQLFLVPVDGSTRPRPLTSGPFEHSGLAWSPDGAHLAFAAARHETWDLDRAVDLFRVATAGGHPERLTETALHYSRPSWSPDGSRLAFLVDDPRSEPRHTQVGVLAPGGPGPRVLTTALDRQCGPFLAGAREPVWDGDDLVFAVEDAGNVHLYRVDTEGGKPEVVVAGDRQVTGWDMAGGMLAFTATTPTELPELFSLGPGGAERRLTHLGRALSADREIVATERFAATSADGSEVEAWVIRPAGFEPGRRYPALLNVHGGPFTQYGNKLFDEFQVQAGAGYAVLYSNPRGSSGYSEAWGRAIRGPKAAEDPGSGWGGVDYEDLMAVVDEAVARFDFVDPGRLGVLGGSYGGYMTSWIVGHTDRFLAACSERAVNNLLTMEHTSDYASTFDAYLGVRGLDDPGEYLRQSPITYVRHMETPVLILHSEEDLRCPVSQAEELFVALRLLGKRVEFVRFPAASHELSRSGAPAHRVRRFEVILDFFSRHLGP